MFSLLVKLNRPQERGTPSRTPNFRTNRRLGFTVVVTVAIRNDCRSPNGGATG